MTERLNIIDRYDLVCMKNDIDNEIRPIKLSLQLKKQQIDGLGEIVVLLSNEIDNIKNDNNIDIINIIDYQFKLNDKISNIEDCSLKNHNKLVKQIKDNVYRFNIMFYSFISILLVFIIFYFLNF